jgi:hypothetical protein
MSTDPYARMADLVKLDDPAETISLREQGRRDPLEGSPLLVQLPGGAEVEIEPGRWIEQGFADHDTGLPPACPVFPLGKDGPICYLIDTQGAVAELDAKSSGKGPLGAVFAGRSRWLEWAFPRWRATKSGKVVAGGWDADDARQCITDACAYKGPFDPEQRVRGRGAWRDEDDSLIYHAGDMVWIGGKWRRCGEHGRFIYPARERLGRPSKTYEEEGPGSPGDLVLEELRTWNWERPDLDPLLMLGWMMTAMVGGALKDRPLIFIPGEEGSGKSRLQQLMRVLMNGALMETEDATAPSIYRRVRQDSVPVLIDEFEASADNRATEKIMTIFRISYSGGKLHRTGENGRTMEFTLKSSCAGSAIAKPSTTSADDSRMAVLMLRPRETGIDRRLLDAKPFQKAGQDLLRRMFEWFPRWDALLAAFHGALTDPACGHTDRGGDTFAALAAGYHVATRDTMPTVAELKHWQGLLAAGELAETSTREKTWRRCFMHMLEAQPEVMKHGSIKSIGQAALAYRDKGTDGLDLEHALALNGMALSWPDGVMKTFDNARVFVPAKHPSLNVLFAGTDWVGRVGAPGPWIGVLRQMPKELYFNGKCEKGLDAKASGIFIWLKAALEA